MPTYDHGVSAATIGVTILTTSGTVYAARATAGITEPVAGSGVYHVAHPAAGTLLIFVFDNGVGTIGASVYSDGVTAPANRVAPDNANIAASAASAASADGKLTAGRLAKVDGAAQETVAATNRAAVIAAVDGNVTGDVTIGPLTLDTTGAAIGVTTPGATATAYLLADTARSTPKRKTTAESDGGWSLALGAGVAWTVWFDKDGFTSTSVGVTT